MKRLLFLFLLPFIMGPGFGVTPGLDKVIIYGDSFNNGGEIRDELSALLGIEAVDVWTFGAGGQRMTALAVPTDEDAENCTAATGYIGNWCRAIKYQIQRHGTSGVCQSFSSANSSESNANLIQDNSLCYATPCTDDYDTGGPPQDDGSPDYLCDSDGMTDVTRNPDCCTGSGAGDCTPTCVDDLPGYDLSVFVIQSTINDMRGTYSLWCPNGGTGSYQAQTKAAWTAAFDFLESKGAYWVAAGNIKSLSDPEYTSGRNDAQVCFNTWVRDTLVPDYSNARYADVYQRFEEVQTIFGDAVALELRENCSEINGDNTACPDGIHPENTNKSSAGFSGSDLIAETIAPHIRALVELRKNE